MKRLIKKYAIDFQKAIEEFNELNKSIYYMDELNDFLYNYGYSEDDEIDIINENNFNKNDECFWQNQQNGYLYSGSFKDAYYTLIYDSDKSSKTLYRYVVNINGKYYGLLAAIDKLLELNKIDRTNPLNKLSLTLFSSLTIPSYSISQLGMHWFTEKGNEKYKYAINTITNLLEEKGYIVKQLTINTDEYISIDDYQAVIK